MPNKQRGTLIRYVADRMVYRGLAQYAPLRRMPWIVEAGCGGVIGDDKPVRQCFILFCPLIGKCRDIILPLFQGARAGDGG
jgi:hypothetical protein